MAIVVKPVYKVHWKVTLKYVLYQQVVYSFKLYALFIKRRNETVLYRQWIRGSIRQHLNIKVNAKETYNRYQ